MKTNLLDGPDYFDCFPNLSLDYQGDDIIHEVRTIHVQTKGPRMKPRTKKMYLKYRTYYKALAPEDLSPRALHPTSKLDRTMMYQSNIDNIRVTIPTPITWTEVILGNKWDLKQVTQLKPIIHSLFDRR